MDILTFCQPTEKCCVIEEQQSLDGVAIMTSTEIQRTSTQNPILFTGTYEECDQYRNQFTPDNPYLNEVSIAGRELIASANREHEEYCVPDDVWPSRRWNKEGTDYIDLSGE